MRILVINPGSTSTKIAVFEDENEVFSKRIDHPSKELGEFDRLMEQKDYRKQAIIETLREAEFEISDFSAIACRGGILPPLAGGTYKVEENMVGYLSNESPVEHASNLAAVIGYELAKPYGIPVYITDPISVDEMIPEAKLSGIPEIERKSYGHYLNMKAVVREIAEKEFGKKYDELNFVVVHLGGGISVAAFRKGKVIDINNANDEGPFSPERTGELPVGDLVKIAYSGKYSKRELKKRYVGKGGLVAYLGTNDMREALRRASEGDKEADLIVRAMAYQIAKEIGGMMAVLKGEIDGIILTGGIAYNKNFTDMIRNYVERYARVYIVPGEFEMIALAKGALRVLKGEEEAKQWKKEG
ncbi:MAG: butyrate kinase [Thermotogaceae bacterium]|nr:butyrate kinase [Thermotogaceae bacterium]